MSVNFTISINCIVLQTKVILMKVKIFNQDWIHSQGFKHDNLYLGLSFFNTDSASVKLICQEHQ